MINAERYSGLNIPKEFDRIKGISFYNNNFYIGIIGQLLYGKSDDDNETEWYIFNFGNLRFEFIGYSYESKGDLLEITSTKHT